MYCLQSKTLLQEHFYSNYEGELLQNDTPLGKKEFLKGIKALFYTPATCP